jgi:hypothetical protein
MPTTEADSKTSLLTPLASKIALQKLETFLTSLVEVVLKDVKFSM